MQHADHNHSHVHGHHQAKDVHREMHDVPNAKPSVGDRIRVRSSEKVPSDGTVVDGSSAADESMLTLSGDLRRRITRLKRDRIRRTRRRRTLCRGLASRGDGSS